MRIKLKFLKRVIKLLLIGLFIESSLILVGVESGIISPLSQLRTELNFLIQDYVDVFLAGVYKFVCNALAWDNLVDFSTRNPVACLLFGMFIYSRYEKVFEVNSWLSVITWLVKAYTLIVLLTFISPILYFFPLNKDLISLLLILASAIVVLFSCFNWNKVSDIYWWVRLILLTLVVTYFICLYSMLVLLNADWTHEVPEAVLTLLIDFLPAAWEAFYYAPLVYRSVAFLLFALFMSSKLCRRWLFLIVAAVLILTALTIIIVLLASSRHADFRDIDLVLTVLTSPTGLLWLGLFFFVCCVILWYFW